MPVYFYAPVFHVAAVAEHQVTHDEGGPDEHTLTIEAQPAEARLGKGDPIVEAYGVPGARYRHDSDNDRYVVCAPEGTTARDAWVSQTYEEVNTDYPGVF